MFYASIRREMIRVCNVLEERQMCMPKSYSINLEAFYLHHVLAENELLTQGHSNPR
jgi:hypothetical protein